MKKRTAIVYDRVNKWGGAERVLLALHELFPEAPLYTSVFDGDKATWAKVFPEIKTTFLQKIPLSKSNHEFLAPFMPIAFESFDFSDFDLVISVTSEFAKAVRTGPNTLHICYCLTPTRYLWSGYDIYFGKYSLLGFFGKPLVGLLRKVDKLVSQRPDKIVSISSAVAGRVNKYYQRDSDIIFPPVSFGVTGINSKRGKYFLIVSRLVHYKRIDLAIKVFNKLGYELVIVGSGREKKNLKKIAAANIKFLETVSERKLAELYSGATALIMPQEEDFGIVSLEAQFCGTPVIAYKEGGAGDTVLDGKTGILFEDQTEKSLSDAIEKFRKSKFDKASMVKNAKRFSKEIFMRNFLKLISEAE